MNARALLFAILPLAAAATAHAQGETIKLESIRSQTDEVQSQTRLSRERLAVIAKALMAPTAAPTTIDVADETSAAFKLVAARATLDDVLLVDRHDGTLDQKQLPLFTGGIAPGAHTVKLEVTLQGNGFGVFTYLRGYKITLTSSHTFVAADGKPIHLTATTYELNDVTVPFERRPQIRWALPGGGTPNYTPPRQR